MSLRTTLAVLAPALALAAPAMAEPAPTYCRADETVVFSCDLGSHTASVCASKDIAPGRGSLSYRFGHLDRVLTTYPAAGVAPSEAFTSGMLSFPGGAGFWLRFEQQKSRTTAFIAVGHWKPDRIDVVGGVVDEEGKETFVSPCRSVPSYEMSSAFFEQAGIKASGSFTLPAEVIPK